MADIRYEFSNKKKSRITKYDISLYTLYNFKTINNDGPEVTLNGKYFPVKFECHYGHLLLDYIGPYLYLKTIYPDLKLIFFKFGDFVGLNKTSNVCNELAGIFDAKVIDIYKDNYCLDEIIIPLTEDNSIDAELFSSNIFSIPIIKSSYFSDGKDLLKDDDE